MSIEERMAQWLAQPGTVVTEAERKFIADLRAAAAAGCGYGWMQQVIEWEWQSKSNGAWGPEYFNATIDELKRKCAALERKYEERVTNLEKSLVEIKRKARKIPGWEDV